MPKLITAGPAAAGSSTGFGLPEDFPERPSPVLVSQAAFAAFWPFAEMEGPHSPC